MPFSAFILPAHAHAPQTVDIRIAVITQQQHRPPFYDLGPAHEDEWLAGGGLTACGNNTTKQVRRHLCFLEEVTLEEQQDAIANTRPLVACGVGLSDYKGISLSLWVWDQQFCQHILVVQLRSKVSIVSKAGFLHLRMPLDALDFNQAKSECRLH